MFTLWKKHVSRACSQVCQIILKHCQHWSTLSACQNIWWPSLAVPSDIKGSCQNTETALCPVGQFNSFAMLTLTTLICASLHSYLPNGEQVPNFKRSQEIKTSEGMKWIWFKHVPHSIPCSVSKHLYAQMSWSLGVMMLKRIFPIGKIKLRKIQYPEEP